MHENQVIFCDMYALVSKNCKKSEKAFIRSDLGKNRGQNSPLRAEKGLFFDNFSIYLRVFTFIFIAFL